MIDVTADQTAHIIDAIDGALEDWTVSGDAMRWTPDAPTEPGWASLTGPIWTDEETDLRGLMAALRMDAYILAAVTVQRPIFITAVY